MRKKTSHTQKNLEYFLKKYSSLNTINQHIVFETLKRMNRSYNRYETIDTKLMTKIELKRREKGWSHDDLRKSMSQKLNYVPTEKTYDSYRRRKSTDSDLFEAACVALNISQKEVDAIKHSRILKYFDLKDPRWLFKTLSARDQSAILYLVSALYMSEHSPEVFDDDYE